VISVLTVVALVSGVARIVSVNQLAGQAASQRPENASFLHFISRKNAEIEIRYTGRSGPRFFFREQTGLGVARI